MLTTYFQSSEMQKVMLILQLFTYSVYLQINQLPAMQKEWMNPSTTQTSTKDHSPVCGRTHQKGTQEKGSFFPPLCSPLPNVHNISGTVSCHRIQRTCGYLLLRNKQKKESFGSPFLPSWPWPGSRQMPMSLYQLLHSWRNRVVSRDHAVSVVDLESDQGFKQSSAVSQKIKNFKKRHLCLSASFSTKSKN